MRHSDGTHGRRRARSAAVGAALLLTGAVSVAQAAPLMEAAVMRMEEPGPVGMLMQAQVHETHDELEEAADLYRRALVSSSPETRWGQVACLRLASWHLRQAPADPAAAADQLSKLPERMAATELAQERRLWQLVVDLHGEASRWLAEQEPADLSLQVDSYLSDRRVPPELRRQFDQMLTDLRQRFIRSERPDDGAAFFLAVLRRSTDAFLQHRALRHLVPLAMAAEQLPQALQAARSYWALSVLEPNLLPDAIDQVSAALEAAGADAALLQRYRRLQRTGELEGQDVDPLEQMLAADPPQAPLIPQHVVEDQASLVLQTRLLLINGDLAAAVSRLQRVLAQASGARDQPEQVMKLVQVAIALHDGHLHDVNRYERFLYRQQADPDAGSDRQADPLEQLLEASLTTARRASGARGE